MQKTYCDRCKKDLEALKNYEIVYLQISDLKEYAINNQIGIDYSKTLCPKCAKDIINIIDKECSGYQLITKVVEK